MSELKIPSEIIRLLEDADWICLATRDVDGEPNAANKFLLKCEQNTVYLVDFVKGTTWENLKNHPRVSFPIMDIDNLVDYQLSGEVEIIEKGQLYDELIAELKQKHLQFSTKRIIEGIRRERGHNTFNFPNIEEAEILRINVDDIVVRGPSVQVIKD